jgi:carbonic anhydrase/acetyltransferase-like protein (isoleucine patch superfamily)
MRVDAVQQIREVQMRVRVVTLASLFVVAPLGAQHTVAKGGGGEGDEHAAPACASSSALSARGAIYPANAKAAVASFVDRTVQRVAPERVHIGCRSYVAPFVALDPKGAALDIGTASNLQDNVTVTGRVTIGDRVSVAHGATIVGPATIGAPGGLPAFVGFNSVIDGATVEPDAMVTHLVKVSPGIVIRAGTKVLPGKWIKTQEEADNEALGKVVKVNDADREFMHGVLHVNNALAAGYAALVRESPVDVRGAGRDPGHSDFNHDSEEPSFAGHPHVHPSMHLRVIGGVTIAEGWRDLDHEMGSAVSLRADEGEHFRFGRGNHFADHVTFHALEHSNIEVGNGVMIGFHAVVHGGADDLSEAKDLTQIGDRTMIGANAVFFRSKAGDGVQIGERAYVDGCHLAPGTVVPARTVMVKDKVVGTVEW